MTFRLLLAALVTGAWVLPQEPVYTLRVDVPVVSLDVSVNDASGKAVNDLSVDDFSLFEDGIRQDIRYFSPVSTPYNILLLFDRSGSTEHKWPFMQKAVAGFIASLRPQDRLAVGTFDSEVQMQMDWTGDRGRALLALPQLINPKAVGGTNFYEAVERTLTRQFRNVTGRRALVVLTDGRDTSLYRTLVQRNRLLEPSEDRGFLKAYKAAQTQRIPVYFVALNTDNNLEPNTIGGDEYRNLQIIFPKSAVPQRYLSQVRVRMEQLANVSGGRTIFPNSIEEIIPLYQQIGRELGMSYSLGYVPSNPAATSSFRKIEVQTRSDQLRLTQTRTGYYAK
jgi:VWFA-related protein